MSITEEMRAHLEEKLLPFWKNLKDNEYGGYYGFMDAEGKLDRQAVKGCILNSRILWFFSSAWMALQDPGLKEYADHAYLFLKEHCLDRERGGVYWSVTWDGKPEDTTKHTYNQAFAVYALSSYYAASGCREALELALELQEVIESKCFDQYGYKEALDIDFRPVDNDKLSENGVMADRTMNTLLHVFEAYTELLRVSGNETAGEKLRWMMDLLADRIYNPVLHRQEVFFDNEMNSLIDLHSYGHDIETAWLVDRGVEVLGDPAYRAKMAPVTADLEQNVYETAYRRHSLKNECERGVDDEWRVWWVQAESMVGFYNAWQKAPEKSYFREAALDIWEFIKKYVVDSREGGEWYWRVDENGRPDLAKPVVEPWKCPYHNGRMCMEMMKRAEAER
ncbi:MAG: N-acylglucosamine 2-epimerase [Lachnospiraceae bacterium]|nr:N-acylglucosamine 2-epimerase [Lachnospiraceae bacterium]